MFASFLALASLIPSSLAYSLCNPSDVKGPITIPIKGVLSTSPITISGDIEIIDGCTVSRAFYLIIVLSQKFQIF
jgi:hypothetical protein